MYNNKSHAKQADPTSITDPISKAKAKGPVNIKKNSKEEADAAKKKADAIKEANKKKAARGDFSYMTDAEKKKSAKELYQVQAQKSKAAENKRNAEAAKEKISKEINNDKTLREDSNKRDDKDLVIENTKPKSTKPKSNSYADAAKKDPKLNSYIKQRKGLTKGTPEYNAVQNKINAAYGKGPQRSTKTVDSSNKKSTIKSKVVDYNPAAEKKKAADARNAKEKAANESKASKLAETKKTATTKIDKKKLKSQAGEGYKEALSDAKKKKASAKESLKQKASGEKALSYGDSDKNKKEIKKENVKLAKSSNKIDKKKIKSQAGEGAKEALSDAKSKRRSGIREAKGKGPKRKEVKANNRASYAEAAKKNMDLDASMNESPMMYAGMKMNKSKPMMKGKLCMKSFRSGRRG